ncbi:PAS domain S-box protein [Gigaspora margarita]|uniref:PAS domain S-box protein n=1 Tax=Gigaspora margarita TaxID=4874 RepID=A0A8H4AVJ5_GIGMA|nr:PAS domain S-box protein [Gigaspora margarita]
MSTDNGINQQEETKVVDLLNSRDWSSTCLGSIDSWEPSFKNIVNLFFHSKFPTVIFCGPELIYIYNQANAQHLKSKHPHAFGKSFAETHPEHFDHVKSRYERIKSTGKGLFEKDFRFIQYNDDYLEELYISYTMSPIYKEDGTFWAAYNVCDFTTHKVLANRRIKALSDLANHINDADSLESACHIIMRSFRENDKDIPFALIYLIDNDKLRTGFQPRAAHLISTTFNYKDLYNKNWDIPDNLLETPKTINLIENPDEKYDLFIEVKRPTSKHLFLKCKSWPVHFVVKEDKDIKVLLKDGSQAVLFPIKASYGGELILSSILICGINPNRELDNDYTNFLRSVVTYVSTIITNGKIREDERKQVELLANLNHQKLKFFQNISRELQSPLTLILSPLDEAINSCLQETIMHSHLQIVQRNTHRLLKADDNSGLDYGADDYLVKPFSARELIARIHTNIKLSQLRNQLISQQCKQEEIKQLLTSISSNILSGLDLKETLSEAVKDIHQILSCDRVFAISYEPSEFKNYTIIALSKDSKAISDTKFGQLEATINQLETSNYEDKEFKIEVLPNTYCIDICKQVSMLSMIIKIHDGSRVGIKAHRSPNSSWTDSEIKLFQQISIQINLVFDYMTLLEEKLANESRIKFIKATDNVKHMILANMSHELRTPLGTVMSICSSFENEALTVQQKNLNKILIHASNIVLSTINNIPNIVNIEEYKSASVNRVFDLLDLFENVIEIFGERAGNKKIELALNYNSDTLPKYVKSDPERLRLVLMNLLSNSIKFTEDGEVILKVLLKSSSDESSKEENFTKLLIILSDTGIGINSEFINNLQSNLKVDESKIMQQDGTGFGLLACKQLVEINGGEMGVESQLEKGSKFWFTWNVEIAQGSYTKETSNYYINSSKMLFNRFTNCNLKRIMLIHPLKNIRDAITICFKDCFDIDLFDTYNEGIETAIYYKELYNRPPYCMAFINIDENNADKVVKTALKLREIHNDDLLIIFIVFSNITGRALLKKLIKKIGGKIASIFKPITPKKLLSHYFQNNIEENIINEEVLNIFKE